MDLTYRMADVEVTAENPYAGDLLERKACVENLAALLRSTERSFVLAVNGSWGTGKTTILRMLEATLQKADVPVAYFNAWESDFAIDPLIPLVAELRGAFEPLLNEEDAKRSIQAAWDKVRGVGSKVLRRSLPLLVRYGTSGLIGDLPGKTEVDLAKVAEAVAKEEIDGYRKTQQVRRDFQESLEELVAKVASIMSLPTVVLIDELDRCRPSFAVELLERMKHLFRVQGIVFVLAIDREQIQAAVRGVYGEGVDADGYLRRFIDLNFQLPEVSRKALCNQYWAELGLEVALKGRNDPAGDREAILRTIVEAADSFQLTARTVGQCFVELSIVLRTTATNMNLLPLVVAQLLVLRATSRKLYQRIVSNQVSASDACSALRQLPGGNEYADTQSGLLFQAFLSLWLANGDQLLRAWKADKTERSAELVELREHVVRTQANFGIRDFHQQLGYIASKLELSEAFQRAPQLEGESG